MRRLAALLLLVLPLLAGADTTLRFCAAGSPKTFDPAMTDSGVDHITHLPIFGTLIETQRGTDQLIPGLATSWSLSPDGLAYTFELRRGVAWQTTDEFKPTREFNADDVLFTFGRLLNRPDGPGGAFAKALPGVSPYVVSFGWEKLVRKVEKLGGQQVRITLAERDASFLSALTFVFAAIQSAEQGAQLLKAGRPQRIAQQPVGTGPFQLKSFRQDAVIRYVKHPGWWRRDERPRADQLVFAITPDANVRAQRLKRDECDIAAPVGPAELAELKKAPAIKLVTAPGMNVGILAYNTRRPALARPEVRQALDMAIDKAAILRTVYGDAGVIASSPIPAANWAHDETLRPTPHDPARARALLEKAGVLPLNLTLWAMPVVRAYNPNGQLMAQMIQADWAKVGVTARIVTYEWGEYLRRIDAGEHDAALSGWYGDPEPANTAGQLACGAFSGTSWCNPVYDKLLAEARQALKREDRKPLYARAQRLAMQELPWSPIAYGQLAVPERATVRNFVLELDGSMYFDGVLPR
ncbi:ABC transporter substrate-binding protein [Roseateles saccharophilus]|uniref:Dipeptide transport system substrate-binding protein n=1 Tax=Roseateles saccharophilus TaxID=304 RepID=A0A4R3UI73_ROSSA|nr:ABC transporter substrate-binding protein [Roseateles saccharophilus]MDG0835908.1 ABC transporter substrate-binding protein [Roseateles saccharophilus]TCU89686.1 dipeptide transport system substrate-binding protein [Roseateles saccharophilus]